MDKEKFGAMESSARFTHSELAAVYSLLADPMFGTLIDTMVAAHGQEVLGSVVTKIVNSIDDEVNGEAGNG